MVQTLEADRVAQILKSDQRYNRLRREIEAGTADDPGSDGPAALSRKIVQDAIAIAGSGGKTRPVRRVADECALDRFYNRANTTLTPQQYGAGIKFRRAWLCSARRARVTQTYDTQEIERGDLVASEVALNAREVVTAALEALSTPQRRAVVAVCGEDERVGLRAKTLCLGLERLHELWRKK